MPTLQESRKRAKDERLQAHKIDDSTYRVYNVAKGTQYDVIRSANGTWYCTCPFAVKGSHIRPGFCKHYTRVLDKINGLECSTDGCDSRQNVKNGQCVGCRSYDRIMNNG